jgi:GNAT superfamily N-acetyltransferase
VRRLATRDENPLPGRVASLTLGAMDLLRLDPRDDAAVDASMVLEEAARAVDEPWNPPMVRRSYVAHLSHGWDGEPGEKWLLYEGDKVIGHLGLYYSQRENLHRAGVGVLVHPDERRKGHGTRLLEEALERVRKAGRRLVGSGTLADSTHADFARKMGFREVLVEVHRRQDLQAVDNDQVAKLLAKAREAARDYTLLRFTDAVPDDLLDAVAELSSAINDAPTGDMEVDDDVFDGTRIRAFEEARVAEGVHMYRLVARLGTDGPLAGHTIVGVHPDQPEWGGQYDTAVVRAHRGHRLGLLLKAEMMAWLAEAEPQTRWVDTWNAESNAHMIGVNEALGYRIAARYASWERDV